MDELDKLAIEAARNILAAETESPGSQEWVNVEAAREILGKYSSIRKERADRPSQPPHPQMMNVR